MKIVINPAYNHFASFVNSIPEQFAKEGRSIYKGRNEIKVFEVEDTELNVKQYKVPILINRLIYTFFRPAKASRAYKYALKLFAKGFDTPQPVAYILSYKTGLLHHAYFVSFQSSYTRNMYEFGEGTLAGREHIIRALAEYTARLHQAGVYHKDFSPGNILFEETEEGVKFCLIDINRMKFAPVSIEKGCANFARLWGKEDLFVVLAETYARAQNVDCAGCLKQILYYRARFWKKFGKKHEIPFEMQE
ncbi:MAG: lipopolysaccharide kinase InaA family protein [Tannerellaceae bacterium]|jgi:serine/threonine protein kinase|nr:lipopolysaccharide kinase InaA family protein [Tannerellaceae bacterium]